MAGLIATRPGLRTRLFYRLHVYHGRKREPKGLGEDDYMRLLCAVHTQLRAPLILIWDNLNHHVSAVMREFVDAHDWLTVVQLPAYAPELNPVHSVWPHTTAPPAQPEGTSPPTASTNRLGNPNPNPMITPTIQSRVVEATFPLA
jgi:DDE superfamily endonuclease